MGLDDDIKNALNIANRESALRNKYDDMTSYSRIYYNTTENLKSYMPILNGNYKSALLPTASGDHQLEAILSGISDITCFDINVLTKYFVKLKFEAFKNFNRDEYIKFMYDNMLDFDMFGSFKNSLDDETRIFWEELYKNIDIEKIRFCLFRLLGIEEKDIIGSDFSKYCVDNFTSYLNTDNYKLVQDRLSKVNIEYIDSNLLYLKEKLRHKYDLINLSNIYEYINRLIYFKGDKKFANVVYDMIDFLNDSGKLLITYLYKCDINDMNKYKDKSIMYARILGILNETFLISDIYDYISIHNDSYSLTDKLCMFRNFQMLRYMKDLAIDTYEVDSIGLGRGESEKDLVMVYTK